MINTIIGQIWDAINYAFDWCTQLSVACGFNLLIVIPVVVAVHCVCSFVLKPIFYSGSDNAVLRVGRFYYGNHR